ncbi:hypothetical protein WMY93_000682 [Mugilogobius chulae]|uniref:L1 transposable element RRM domain-containing protein n=1 Tax=Mugilogobius chulae TaxID=88201 RepID=A0AAW0Q5S5_9GOBI
MPPPKKTQTQTKASESALDQQVTDMAADKTVNSEELSALIRTIIREEINAAMEKLQPQLDNLKEDLNECTTKLFALETSLSSMESRISDLEKANEELGKENKDLKDKADRMEDRSRKYNIRILGIPIDAERGNPTSYVSALLKEHFKDKLQYAPEVEIAHRTGPVNKSGQRIMIVRMLRLAAREEILRIAKNEKEFVIRGMKLRIFPDFTAETAKARASFREVRNKLWSAGVKHSIIHPATLILTFKGETKKFNDHQHAENYVKTVIEKEKP